MSKFREFIGGAGIKQCATSKTKKEFSKFKENREKVSLFFLNNPELVAKYGAPQSENKMLRTENARGKLVVCFA